MTGFSGFSGWFWAVDQQSWNGILTIDKSILRKYAAEQDVKSLISGENGPTNSSSEPGSSIFSTKSTKNTKGLTLRTQVEQGTQTIFFDGIYRMVQGRFGVKTAG